MELYCQRFTDFFFQSLQTLKEESGRQRWNEICEDTTELFFYDCAKRNLTVSYTYSELWQMLFEPNLFYDNWKSLLQNIGFHSTAFLTLHALLDPPAPWWQAQFR